MDIKKTVWLKEKHLHFSRHFPIVIHLYGIEYMYYIHYIMSKTYVQHYTYAKIIHINIKVHMIVEIWD